MKNLFVVIFLMITSVCFSQIPDGYYDSAEGLSGEELKTALHNIIKNHIEYPYTSSSTDVWDILKESDKDLENSDNVILFYTGWSVNAAQEWNSGSGWSREHVWAKSRGDFDTDPPEGTDAHHLRPADVSVNSARNNRWFNYCDEEYYDAGIPTGNYTSSTDWFWQPRDEVKGDVARMIFYMATRYEGDNGELDLEVIDSIPSDKFTKAPIHAKLDALLDWNEEDPVDDFERNRNDVVYSYQNNRNPFIDHPEFVNAIFNEEVRTSTKKIDESENITFYPNPTDSFLIVNSHKTYSIEIYSIVGHQVILTKEKQIDVSELKQGIYLVLVKNQTGKIIKSGKIVKK